MIGKWHLGYNKWTYTPTYRGFDTFYGSYNGGHDHYTHKRLNILDFRDNEEPVRDQDGTFGTFAFAEVFRTQFYFITSSSLYFLILRSILTNWTCT